MKALSLKTLITISAIALLAGCSTVTNKEVGQIDFSYTAAEQQKDTGKVISVVTPDLIENQTNTKQSQLNNNAMLMMMAQANAQQAQVDFNGRFNQSYKDQLISALQNTFNQTISNSGFRTTEFSTFDDMTYTDKKETYLASVPKLNLNITKKVTKQECKSGYCTEQGVIQITGELNVSLIEPLTQQTFINKRINLSDLNISKDYIKQEDTRAPQGLMAIPNALLKPKQYEDNTDKALTDALNEFYSKASTKIAQHISREELLTLANDIENLKKSKRY